MRLDNIAPPPEADLRKPQQQAELAAQQQLSRIAQAPATAAQKEEAASEVALASQQQVAGAQAQELQAAAQQGLQQRALQADAAKLQKVKELRARKLQVAQEQRKAELGLAALDATANERVYQANTKFARDEMGRLSLNEVQLADWALMNAQNEEELRNFESVIAIGLERKQQIMRISAEKVLQAMMQEFEQASQEDKQQLGLDIAEFKKAVEKSIADAKSRAASASAAWGAGFTILSSVASMYNPLLGAAVSGIGTLVTSHKAEQAGSVNQPKPKWEK